MASLLESYGGGANAVAFHEHADTEGWWSAAEARGIHSYLQIVFPLLKYRISHVVEGMRWALDKPELDLSDGAWVIDRTEELIEGLELAARDMDCPFISVEWNACGARPLIARTERNAAGCIE